MLRPRCTGRFLGTILLGFVLAGCKSEVTRLDPEETKPAESLQLAGGKLQTEAVAANGFMVCVTSIDFTDVPIGDAELEPAGNLPYLRTLALRGTKVTDAALPLFKGCQLLDRVDLSQSPIAGSGLSALHFNRVRDLNLASSKFDDRGVAELIEMGHHLVRLNLAATAVTDDGMERLSFLRGLEVLDLSQTKITGAGLRYLPSGLKRLNLSGAPLADASLGHLEPLNVLEELDLSETPISDEALPHIRTMAEAQGMKMGSRRFMELNLHKTQVSDKGIEALKRALPGLRVER
jgi:internalin A